MNISDEDFPVDYNDTREHFYYDIFNIQYSRATDSQLLGYGITSTFLRIIFVFISRIGFILIQIGTIPVENVYRILFYNIFEIANAIASYALVGYMLSFGETSFAGWISYSNNLSYNLDEAIVGFSACLIGTAQISTFLIGRINFMASVLITCLYCSTFQPILLHWIWNSNGWMNRSKFLHKRVSVKDHAGALVIHLSSSIIGLIGVMFLGRRLIKVKDLDEHSLGREHSANTIIGYVFLVFGYIALSLPTPVYQSMRIPSNYIGIVVLNNLIALAAGIIVASFLHLLIYRKIFNYWIVTRCIQGGIAGIISIAAGVDIYSPLICLGLAAVASVFFFAFSVLIHNTSLEDHCNLAASHLVCSLLGILACPTFADKENFNNSIRKVHILWQFICLLTVVVLTVLCAWVFFFILSVINLLRSKSEALNHRRAVAIQKYLPERPFLKRLFVIDSQTEHITPGDELRKNFIDTETTEGEREVEFEKSITIQDKNEKSMSSTEQKQTNKHEN